MLSIDETIDAFRRGALEIDCNRMVLTQQQEGGERFEGQGYIRQADDGTLIFKIYVANHNAKPLGHLGAMFSARAGKLYVDEAFYALEVTGRDGTIWAAKGILPAIHWGAADTDVMAQGRMQSMIAHLDLPQPQHYLRLHFFEEYEIPCLLMSKIEDHGDITYIRDRAEFEVCGAKFEVRKHEILKDTIIELTSETEFPESYDLRIQEAFQYIVAKPAFWRATLQTQDKYLLLELTSPWRKSSRTQFSPPISPASTHYYEYGWRLFEAYLAYVTQKTRGTHWNPVAYHLNNACESTANSVDARAVGISVAVEAVAGLIVMASDDDKAKELAKYQQAALAWLVEQKDVPEDIVKRFKGQIGSMSNKRPQDVLFALADKGRVKKDYVNAWKYLRNRHVHPKLIDLQKPSPVDMQKLLDHIHKVEVLLRQLTFHLIGYEGYFTDYGVHGKHAFPSKQYPLDDELSLEKLPSNSLRGLRSPG